MGPALCQEKREATVDLDSIVAELKGERDRIGRVIASLLEGAGKGIIPIKAGRPKKRPVSNTVSGYWKVMSFEERSAEMKRRAKVRAKNRKKSK
jgi:hypothetical protein